MSRPSDKIAKLLPDTLMADFSVVALAHGFALEGVKRLGLAVSGGSDSMALFHLLVPWCRAHGVAVMALHFNHGLRGAEADADEAFVAQQCRALDVPFFAGRARDLADPQKRRHGSSGAVSLEMAARAARHAFLREMARRQRLDAIALAHHRDDVAETLLLRLARGSGATGLGGMKAVAQQEGVVYLRPLLEIGRLALRQWLVGNGLTWREDLSNEDVTIQRNLVRLRLLPALRDTFGIGLDTALARSAAILRADDALLNELADTALITVAQGEQLVVAALLAQPVALRRRIVYQWLLRLGGGEVAGFDTVERILRRSEPQPRRRRHWRLALAVGFEVRCAYGMLALHGGPAAPPSDVDLGPAKVFLRRDHEVVFNGVGILLRRGHGIVRDHNRVGELPACCSLSAAALHGKRLAVRYRQPGDRLTPLGLQGSRKVQDVLSDARIPAAQRDAIPLLVCGDEVLWLPGYRVAARYAVEDEGAAALAVAMRAVADSADARA